MTSSRWAVSAPSSASGAKAGAILQWNPWAQCDHVDDPTDKNHLSGLEPTPWMSGRRLLSGRPQVRVLSGAPRRRSWSVSPLVTYPRLRPDAGSRAVLDMQVLLALLVGEGARELVLGDLDELG